MDVSSLPGLPLVIAASAAGVAEAVSALLALFAGPLANVPGLRPTDDTRNAFLRAVLFLLTLAGLIGLAWTQNVVIARGALPALLVTAAGASTVAHTIYLGVKAFVPPVEVTASLTPAGAAALAQQQNAASASVVTVSAPATVNGTSAAFPSSQAASVTTAPTSDI